MKKKDISGMIFHDLNVLYPSTRQNAQRQIFWICKCKCGNVVEVRGDNLRNGNSKRCKWCGKKVRDICGQGTIKYSKDT